MRISAVTRTCLLALATVLTVSLAGPSPAYAALPSEATWHDDVDAAMTGSQTFLEDRARGGDGLAVNLDIDNTALASHYDSGQATARVLRFARKAHRLGVAVLFNTARAQGKVGNVARVLRREGYAVDGICGRRRGEAVVDSKQRCRRTFTAEGWTIVANVGNSPTDFTGGDYERAYRLPSYDGQLT